MSRDAWGILLMFAVAGILAIGIIIADIHRVNWCKAYGYDWTVIGRGIVLCEDSEGRLMRP